jgi:hypothetical protein
MVALLLTLLAAAINDEVQRSTLHPHILMKEVLTFLWFIRFVGLDLGGGRNGGTRF